MITEEHESSSLYSSKDCLLFREILYNDNRSYHDFINWLNLNYKDEFFTGMDLSETTLQDSYVKVDARLGFATSDDPSIETS